MPKLELPTDPSARAAALVVLGALAGLILLRRGL